MPHHSRCNTSDRKSYPEAFALGGLRILQYVRGKFESAEDYTALDRRCEETHFDFGVVRFVSYGDLLDMKTLAGRDQDLVDIRALREARGDIGPT